MKHGCHGYWACLTTHEDLWSMLRAEYDRIATARFRAAENTEVSQQTTASNTLATAR